MPSVIVDIITLLGSQTMTVSTGPGADTLRRAMSPDILQTGVRSLVLGPEFKISADSACCAELGGLQGTARVVA
jgi:hypothetical protein